MSSGTLQLSRALISSTAACAFLYIVFIAAFEISRGRAPRLHAVVPFAVVMVLAVGLSGAVVQWPILRLIRSFKRPIVIGSGAFLGIVPLAIVILLLRDSDDETFLALIQFWLHVPGEFLIGFFPMAVAGGVLGWFASMDVRSAA